MNIFRLLKFLILTIIFTYIFAFSLFHYYKHQLENEITSHSKIIELEDGRLEYATNGEGPPMLFFHGAQGVFDQVFPFKFDGFQNIYPSRPGYLNTDLSSRTNYDNSSKIYLDLIDSLGLEKVAVGGVSAGGMTALNFALRYPERVSGILLISAVIKERIKPIPKLENHYIDFLFGEGFHAWLLSRLIRFDPDFLLQSKNFLLSKKDQEIMYNNPNKFDTLMNLLEHTFIFASKRQVGYINDRIRYSNIGEPDLPINLPTLVIHGTEDTDVPFNHGESAFSRIHNSKLVTLEGSGHVAIISEWEKINKETNNFFKQNNFLIN